MSDTWRFIIIVTLLVCVAGLAPFAVDDSPATSSAPVVAQGGANG